MSRISELSDSLRLIITQQKFRWHQINSRLLSLKIVIVVLALILIQRCFSLSRATTTYDVPSSTELTQKKYDLFVTSSYYYPKSRSMGNNSLALVFNTNFHFFDENRDIQISMKNRTHTKNTTLKYEIISPHRQCLWVPVYAYAETLPNMKSLGIFVRDGTTFAIPFKVPRPKPRPVVSCIAPLVVMDEWQTLLTSVHVHKFIGSFMHVYWRSVEEHTAGLLREYEKQGYLKLQPWVRADIWTETSGFNVNRNMKLSNRAAAYTDCLLQYKDSVDFITFLEIEDLLFPRIGEIGNLIAEDFKVYFMVEEGTDIIQLNRIEAKAYMNKKPVDHLLRDNLASLEMKTNTKTDVMVAKPSALNYTWIYPQKETPKGAKRYHVSRGMAAVLSLTDVIYDKFKAISPGQLPLYNAGPEPLDGPKTILRDSGIAQIDADFKKMLSIPEYRLYWHGMPQTRPYSSLVKQCMYETYEKHLESGKHSKIMCPNVERCKLPRSIAKTACGMAKAKYGWSASPLNKFNVHYPEQIYYQYSAKCIP